MSREFNTNLTILQERLPELASNLQRAHSPKNREWSVNERGVVVYKVHTQKGTRNLTSMYDPYSEAARQTEGQSVESSQLIFVFGEAGFYHVESALNRAREDSKVILITQDLGNMKLVLESRDLSHVLEDPRFFVFQYSDLKGLRLALATLIQGDLYTVPTFTVLAHPVEAQLQSEFIGEVEKTLHRLLSAALMNLNTSRFFEQWWSNNYVSNFTYLLTDTFAGDLKNSWLKKPCIIVGAGPSLSKNIETLKEVKNKCLVLCVDTAYRALEKHGITPDMIVTLDGSPMNAAHLAGCDYSEVPLLMDVYSHRDIAANHKAPKAVFSTTAYHNHWYSNVTEQPAKSMQVAAGGSVATAAFSFARLIGADPIVLIGVDLSYPNGNCYAPGTLHDSRTITDTQNQRELFTVTDIYGNAVQTTSDYLYYLRWFHDNAKDIHDCKLINATEGGAVREGFTIQTLKEVVAQYCQEDLDVQGWVHQLDPKSLTPEMVAHLRKNFRRSFLELRAIQRYLNITLQQLERYIGNLEAMDDEQTEDSLARVQKGIAKTKSLKLGMSFLDARAFNTVYTDIKLSGMIDRSDESFTASEKAVIRARQIGNFCTQLLSDTAAAIKIHQDGLEGFDRRFLNIEGVGAK